MWYNPEVSKLAAWSEPQLVLSVVIWRSTEFAPKTTAITEGEIPLSWPEYPIGQLLEELFKTVKDRMKHPQVNNDVMTAIDAFMKDDLEDDPEEPLPF